MWVKKLIGYVSFFTLTNLCRKRYQILTSHIDWAKNNKSKSFQLDVHITWEYFINAFALFLGGTSGTVSDIQWRSSGVSSTMYWDSKNTNGDAFGEVCTRK